MLQTLVTLPIQNKTMLQDSKVLPAVEKWAIKSEDTMEPDSESNSPKLETDSVKTEESESEKPPVLEKQVDDAKPLTVKTEAESDDENEIRRSVGMDIERIRKSTTWQAKWKSAELIDQIIEMFEQDLDLEDTKPRVEPQEDERDYPAEILALAAKLLEEWANLKEVFRIPKKERIERMKEHEREANRGYNSRSESDERKSLGRYRGIYKIRKMSVAEANSRRKHAKAEDSRNRDQFPKINKHERRMLFALQVEQEEVRL